MARALNLKEQARSIFSEALRAVDAGAAVRNAVKLTDSSRLTVVDEVYELTQRRPRVYAVALGKAAYPMALALDGVLGDKLIGGVVSGVLPEASGGGEPHDGRGNLSGRWSVFAGGHPLPNEVSLAAARSCFDLLRSANDKRALIVFLISGGGSAMVEAPRDDAITLADLRETNRVLVSCGATIAEVNTVRRAFSLVKGGGLAASAPRAEQITLIVSDTEPGDEASVASGPTIEMTSTISDDVDSIIDRYKLSSRLPDSVLRLIREEPSPMVGRTPEVLRRHHVLLDNRSVVEAAAASANARGFAVEVAPDLTQQHVASGCAELMRRTTELRGRVSKDRAVCLISGGEFACPVRGEGTGGRNAETALRMALMLDGTGYDKRDEPDHPRFIFLSAGTDGIDGNSPAAGAICDDATIARAQASGLSAQRYLDDSDAYTFFHLLGDAIITRPTGTNVRDLRIMIAG